MDLLFKRYANPFVLLNQMIAVGRFEEFIDELVQMQNDDVENETLWELYLHHKFIDKSFNDFKNQLEYDEPEPARPVNLEATVSKSADILNGFVPE